MARIFPERLPEYVLSDPRRAAERKVFKALSELSGQFTIFYNVAWQARSPHAGAEDGEADFVIAHPQLGLLIMEVKGGGIRHDADLAQWVSSDREGIEYDIKDPVEQARRSRYQLFNILRDMPGWDSHRWLTMGQVVAFPDIYTESRPLRLDLPPEIVIDAGDLDDIENALRRTFRYYAREDRHQGPLGRDRLQILESTLARSFQIKTPLGVELAYEDEQLIELTERQLAVLSFLSTRRRAAIKGCAGSGKTMLALEKARRLSERGFKVLLTCFNQALAKDLAQRVSGEVDVAHFHELCRQMIHKSGQSIQAASNEDELYDTVMPNALLDAAEELGAQYDAVIVDEGQDFRDNWWLPLMALLHDQDNGIFYVFFDDNQNLYQDFENIPGIIDEAPFPLTENCRNTQRIHHLVAAFQHTPNNLRSRGPVGRNPKLLEYRGDGEQLRLLKQLLHELVNEQKVSYQDIVILTPRSQKRSYFKEGTLVGNFEIVERFPYHPSQIQISSIHTFKGLERKVVIITEIDPRASPDLTSVLYVGCSRARTHLILLAEGGISSYIESKIG